jgi:hypothetical protein
MTSKLLAACPVGTLIFVPSRGFYRRTIRAGSWQVRGACNKAAEIVAPIEGLFIGGFDTADLNQAKMRF